MRISELTPAIIQSEIKAFHKQLSAHVAWVVKTVGNETMSIPRIPRKMGVHQFDYFYAADLDQIFRFALGGLDAARKFILDLCDTTEALLFTNASGLRTPPPEGFAKTTLGFALAAARARCAVRREGGSPLTADEVRVLADSNDDETLRAEGLLAEGGDAPEAVRAFLEKHDLPV